MSTRNIGIPVKAPEVECDDKHCPFHGSLPVRGQSFVGIVVSDKPQKTVIIKREITKYIKKYERYERRSSKLAAHNPPCINARAGDIVRVMECRPISKTKAFVVVEKLGNIEEVKGKK
jgi:small subunit ribosomal protein S17